MAEGIQLETSAQETQPALGIVIYADGSSRKTGEGGFGFVILKDGQIFKEGSGWEKVSTNNRMELTGVITPLKFIQDACIATGRILPKVTIWSDSEYVVNAFNKGWLTNWKKYNWSNSSGDPVKNQDLWQTLDRLAAYFHNLGTRLEWKWCRGHNGDHWNEHVDKLAQGASAFAKTQKG